MALIEAARPSDLAPILALLTQHGLPPDGLSDHLAHALVARTEGEVVGCAALELYGPTALLRSLAVAAERRGQGLGRQLVQVAFERAQRQGVHTLYLLTTTAPAYFPRFGFRPISRDEVEPAVRQSVEFTSACPASALVMVANLATNDE